MELEEAMKVLDVGPDTPWTDVTRVRAAPAAGSTSHSP